MTPTSTGRLALVGDGRAGRALASALPHASGPHGRGYDAAELRGDALVLLCVPDAEIAAAAAGIPPRDGLLVGHLSGATTLAPLAPHEALSLHPLLPLQGAGTAFAGAGAAVAGSTPRALGVARALADELGLVALEVADEDRAAYHAAASLASNCLLALEAVAEDLSPARREHLVPLVRATVDAWAARGPRAALTGPVVRGDEATVARQRAAVAERLPASLELFDVLTDATRALAARPVPVGPGGPA